MRRNTYRAKTLPLSDFRPLGQFAPKRVTGKTLWIAEYKIYNEAERQIMMVKIPLVVKVIDIAGTVIATHTRLR